MKEQFSAGETVNSHWLACPLAQGTQQHCKVSTISRQNSPFICNFESRCFASPTDFVYWSKTGKRKVKAGLTGEMCGTVQPSVSFDSMYNTTVCKRCMHVDWRWPEDSTLSRYRSVMSSQCHQTPINPPKPLIWGERRYRKSEMLWKLATSNKPTSNDNS